MNTSIRLFISLIVRINNPDPVDVAQAINSAVHVFTKLVTLV